MLYPIPKEICTLINKCTLVTEASSAGLRPGEWPEFVAVLEKANEGFLFGFPARHEDGGRVYMTQDGRFKLHIMND